MPDSKHKSKRHNSLLRQLRLIKALLLGQRKDNHKNNNRKDHKHKNNNQKDKPTQTTKTLKSQNLSLKLSPKPELQDRSKLLLPTRAKHKPTGPPRPLPLLRTIIPIKLSF